MKIFKFLSIGVCLVVVTMLFGCVNTNQVDTNNSFTNTKNKNCVEAQKAGYFNAMLLKKEDDKILVCYETYEEDRNIDNTKDLAYIILNKDIEFITVSGKKIKLEDVEVGRNLMINYDESPQSDDYPSVYDKVSSILVTDVLDTELYDSRIEKLNSYKSEQY